MSDRIKVDVDLARPVSVVNAQGVLDVFAAQRLRAVLVDCLAEQPAGIVVDVTDLVVKDDVALSTLATLAVEARHWPGVSVVLGGVGPDILGGLDRLAHGESLDSYPDRRSALGALSHSPCWPTVRARVAANRDAPARARALVHDVCAAAPDGMVVDRDTALVVISELVTNAVVHAGTSIGISVRLTWPVLPEMGHEPGGLHIAVRDSSRDRPRRNGFVDSTAETGRGLLLVDALATRWDTVMSTDGKVVWALVAIDGRRTGRLLGS